MFDLNKRGIPGTMIATTAFTQAYEAQAEVLGFAPSVVYVPHPIQNRTDDEIRALADKALEEILESLTK